MTPKEKAEMLVDEYYQLLGEYIFNGHFDIAKECALIAVDEILDDDMYDISQELFEKRILYWKNVKKEIKKL